MTNSKLHRILLDKRTIVLIIAIVLAFAVINPNPWRTGITIKSVEQGSAADLYGLEVGERILSIDNQKVNTLSDFVLLTDLLSFTECSISSARFKSSSLSCFRFSCSSR